MITGNDIQSLVDLFEDRQVSLYHACQLIDFWSYLHLGGIPSRALLESKRLPFTPFETDLIDKENSVWDKVFVNLSDFGSVFARGANNVPNPYGPILFQMKSSTLLEASDIAVCLRSAGAQGFNREHEALNTLEEIDRLFWHPSNVDPPQSTYIKYRDELVKEFGNPNAQSPEISCTVPIGVLPTQYVKLVRVDPYVINGRRLIDLVDAIKQRYPVQFPIYLRGHFSDRSRISFYNEIAEGVNEGIPSLSDIASSNTWSQPVRDWVMQIHHLDWQFSRYAKYLRDGTLSQVSRVIQQFGE